MSISGQKVQQMLASNAAALEKAASIIVAQQQELDAYRRQDEARKIASAMQEKHMAPVWGPTEEEAVNYIAQLDNEKRAALEMAIELSAPQASFASLDNFGEEKTASAHSNQYISYEMTGGRNLGNHSFEQLIMGNLE